VTACDGTLEKHHLHMEVVYFLIFFKIFRRCAMETSLYDILWVFTFLVPVVHHFYGFSYLEKPKTAVFKWWLQWNAVND
jgi:hypothetical protein